MKISPGKLIVSEYFDNMTKLRSKYNFFRSQFCHLLSKDSDAINIFGLTFIVCSETIRLYQQALGFRSSDVTEKMRSARKI